MSETKDGLNLNDLTGSATGEAPVQRDLEAIY